MTPQLSMRSAEGSQVPGTTGVELAAPPGALVAPPEGAAPPASSVSESVLPPTTVQDVLPQSIPVPDADVDDPDLEEAELCSEILFASDVADILDDYGQPVYHFTTLHSCQPPLC